MQPDQMGEGFRPPEASDEERPVTGPDQARPDRPKSRSPMRGLLEIVGIFAGAILVAYLLQAFIIKPFQIPSESMEPAIDPGDRIFVNRLAYNYGQIERGDVIVFESPTDPGVDYVKRVIALPGDRIEIKRGQVILNGEPQNEQYVQFTDTSNFPERTVPEGGLFVLGDNRGDSQDSRYWNPPWLSADNVIGEAFFTYWPPDRLGTL